MTLYLFHNTTARVVAVLEKVYNFNLTGANVVDKFLLVDFDTLAQQ